MIPIAFGDTSLSNFEPICSQQTNLKDYPQATEVIDHIVVYDAERLRKRISNHLATELIRVELAKCLATGPGIVIFRQAIAPQTVDQVSRVRRIRHCSQACRRQS